MPTDTKPSDLTVPPGIPPALPPARSRIGGIVPALVLGMAVAGAGLWLQVRNAVPDPPFAYGMKLATPRIIKPVTLTSAAGPVALPYADGKWTFMFFGYTHCPDICPTTMQYLRQEVQAMGAGADKVHVAFVSVDPRRDTPADLVRFAQYYHPAFQGMTGDKSAIDQLTADVGAAYYPGAKADVRGADYDISHSTSIYVINPPGKLVAIYGGSGKPGRLAGDFAFLRP